MSELSHVDGQGRARMVNVGDKPVQRRRARARGSIRLSDDAVQQVKTHQSKKGDVLTVAEIAGIQAAKRTGELIPLCHPLGLDQVDMSLQITAQGVTAECVVHCQGKTGVEMEALTGVSVALLTIYDMVKAVDKDMVIENIHLVEKVKEDVT